MSFTARISGGSVHDSVQPVPGVPEPGNDVGVLVETLIHGGGDDLDLATAADLLLDLPQSLGGDEEADRGDVAGTALEQVLDRGDQRPAGTQHRVEHEHL